MLFSVCISSHLCVKLTLMNSFHLIELCYFFLISVCPVITVSHHVPSSSVVHMHVVCTQSSLQLVTDWSWTSFWRRITFTSTGLTQNCSAIRPEISLLSPFMNVSAINVPQGSSFSKSLYLSANSCLSSDSSSRYLRMFKTLDALASKNRRHFPSVSQMLESHAPCMAFQHLWDWGEVPSVFRLLNEKWQFCFERLDSTDHSHVFSSLPFNCRFKWFSFSVTSVRNTRSSSITASDNRVISSSLDSMKALISPGKERM